VLYSALFPNPSFPTPTTVNVTQADVCTDAMIVERSQLYENSTNRYTHHITPYYTTITTLYYTTPHHTHNTHYEHKVLYLSLIVLVDHEVFVISAWYAWQFMRSFWDNFAVVIVFTVIAWIDMLTLRENTETSHDIIYFVRTYSRTQFFWYCMAWYNLT
jgi:hypothetical protein